MLRISLINDIGSFSDWKTFTELITPLPSIRVSLPTATPVAARPHLRRPQCTHGAPADMTSLKQLLVALVGIVAAARGMYYVLFNEQFFFA